MGLLNQFETFYGDFCKADLIGLNALYDSGVAFRDPVLELKGLTQLHDYFSSSREGVNSCEFVFDGCVANDGAAHYQWTMHLSHPKLKSGALISVRGSTALLFGSRIFYHEDYYDLGAMLYENVPLLGGVVRGLKKRVHGGGTL